MASLVIGAGYLAYGSVKKAQEKKRKKRNAARFEELEKEHAEQVANFNKKSSEEDPPHHSLVQDLEDASKRSLDHNGRESVSSADESSLAAGSPERSMTMERAEIARINSQKKKNRGVKKLFKKP